MDLLIALRDVGLPPPPLDAVEASVRAALAREMDRERGLRPRRSRRGLRPGTLVTALSVSITALIALGAVTLLAHRAQRGQPAARRERVRQPTRREPRLDQAPGVAGYTLVAADVYSEDPQLVFQTISVDKGSDDGVHVNDPVIGDQGLVGKITTVDSTVSVVTLITNPSFEVGAEVQDAAGDQGTLEPETGDPNQMLLQYLPSGAQIAVGELVVTSGFSDSGVVPGKSIPLNSLYPAGIPIGTVSDANSNTLINDQQVQVTPLVDLRHLTTVQILTHAGGDRSSGTA
jgi:hypothetical protein